MSASKPVLYEGMFLFDSAAIQSNVATASEHLREVLGRADAEIISMYKWDERKLAFPVKGQKRGLYMLAYFKMRGTQIPNIERDVNLSELLLRCMILRGEHIGEAELEQAAEQARDTQATEALQGEDEGASGEGGGEGAEAAAPRAEGETAGGGEGGASAPAGEAGGEAEAEADKASEAGARNE